MLVAHDGLYIPMDSLVTQRWGSIPMPSDSRRGDWLLDRAGRMQRRDAGDNQPPHKIIVYDSSEVKRPVNLFKLGHYLRFDVTARR